ncbi:MAG: aminoglycoside adenylyltransferase domain-containing protein [Anaerolineae bacterium]
MTASAPPITPYADVDDALRELGAGMHAVLGSRLVGAYLSGSLALGDFDRRASDIDLVVVTDGDLSDDLLAALREMHAAFADGGSPWAGRVEVVYVSREAVRRHVPGPARYPVLEKGGTLTRECLEIAWPIQLHTVREHGVVVAGPCPRSLIDGVDPAEMRRVSVAIAAMWRDSVHGDPTWLDWVRGRHEQSFVVLTLCRLLYTLDTGGVASKPAAARWVLAALDGRWAPLIEGALADYYDGTGQASDAEVQETVALVWYTLERGSECGFPAPPPAIGA